MISELRKIEEDLNTKYPVKLVPQNYQHIIDISKISIGIINKRLVYILRIPVLEHEDLHTLHLIPIPIHHGNSFIAPFPANEIILINLEKSFYVYSDLSTLQNCKNLEEIKICKRTQPSYLIIEIQNCETSRLRNQNEVISDHICQFSAFRILELLFIPLKDPNQYIIIPEHEIELNTLCNLQSRSVVISKPSLIYSDSDCIIQTPKSILKMLKSIEHNTDIKLKKNISYTIDQSEFELLNLQLPIVQESLYHENLNALKQSLDTMQT